jgi:hypothetical protein
MAWEDNTAAAILPGFEIRLAQNDNNCIDGIESFLNISSIPAYE